MLENNKLRGQEFHCEGPLLGSAQKRPWVELTSSLVARLVVN